MAFDAFFLSAVLEEVRTRCIGARVEKIHQPARDTIIVHLRCQEGREKLLFAANPAAPRLHLTAASPENPAQPPMFCMLLRKHLLGAKLTEVSQPPMERAASFRFDCTDEMGFPVQKTLVAELMVAPAICICCPLMGGFWTACGASALTKAPSGQRCRVSCISRRSRS